MKDLIKSNQLFNFESAKVPKVYWEFCSDRILTMEYCEGFKVDSLTQMKENNVNVNKVRSIPILLKK